MVLVISDVANAQQGWLDMDKAELGRQTLLEMLGDAATLPVDDVIRQIAIREIGVSPAVPLAVVIARPDEFKDRLLAELALSPDEVLARGTAVTDERQAYFLHTFAIYLLALWEQPRAFGPLVAFLTADPDAALDQLGELVTEDLHTILGRVYDGSDLSALKSIVESDAADPYMRNACLRSLHVMSRLGKLPRADLVAYFTRVADSLRSEANADFGDLFILCLAELQEPELRPAIDRWFAEGLVQEDFASVADVDATYAVEHDELNEELLQIDKFNGLIDYICEWVWFNINDPSEIDDLFDDDLELAEDGPAPTDNQPFVREGRKVGRNEPCPCGSGKKYKVCCLDADRA